MFPYQLSNNAAGVEFIEKTHTYIIGDRIAPSVSDIIKRLNVINYSTIPKSILNDKANFGTTVHELIDCHETGKAFVDCNAKDIYARLCYEQYIKLKARHKINVAATERIIAYKDIYAGRFDLAADVNGQTALCDIKTTAKLHLQALQWQLSLYELAAEYTYNLPPKAFDKLYCIWLPKGDVGRLVEVERIGRVLLLEVVESL